MTLIKFPCKDDKSPAVGGWKTYKGAVDSAVVGYMIPDGVIVLDLDTYKDVTCADVEAVLGCELLWHEAELQKTRNGGKHYAFRIPNGCQLRQGSDLFGVKGFDTRASGKGYIASGKGYEDLTLFGIDETLSDPDCLPELGEEALATLDIGFEVVEDDDFGLEEALNNERLGLGADELRAYVEALPDSMAGSGGDWLDIGMGIYHETGGSEEGWKLFDEFSRRDAAAYDEGQNRKRWESWDNQGKRAVTFATVIKKAGGKGVIAQDISANLIDQIKVADEDVLKGCLVEKIKGATLDLITRETVVQCYQGRFKELSGVKLPISDVRRLLSEEKGELEYDKPDWCAKWVYVGGQSKFMNVNTLAALSGEGFNVRYGKKVPVNENGFKTSAVKFVSDYGFVESVEKTAYLPMVEEPICNTDQGRILNTFNKNTVPKAAKEHTKEGLEHVNYIKNHIRLLMGDDKNAEIFTQWLAHQIQFPGVKIPWAPLIQSVQGVGKGIFRELLENCLGYQNVGVVSPKLAISDFNGWATGRTVNILEELKIVGSNRYEAANALKPLITDRTITINDKGISAYTTMNTANYIVFTNYRDAIPLEDSDRRWWVIYVPLNELDDIEKITGIDQQTYFDNVWKAARNYGAEIRKWLLDIGITEEFKALNVAPTTVHKEMMIATEKGGQDHVEDIERLIEKGGEFYCKDAVSSKELFVDAVFEIDGFEMPTNKEKSKILKRLGYSQLPKQIKIRGETKRFWVKHHRENEEIKSFFPF